MWKKFLVATGWLLALMALMGVVEVPVLLRHSDLLDRSDWYLIGVMLADTVVLIAGMQVITRRVFYFPGIGPAASAEQLKGALREPAKWNSPLLVEERNGTFVFTFKYYDETWDFGFEKQSFFETFEVRVRLVESAHECRLVNVTRRGFYGRSWFWGGLVRSFSYHRGVNLSVTSWKDMDLQAAFQRPFEHRLTVNTELLQGVVIQTIRNLGWGVRFTLF